MRSEHTLHSILDSLHLEYNNLPNIRIRGVCGLDDDLEHHISFVSSDKFIRDAEVSKVKAFFVSEDIVIDGKITITCKDPFMTMIHCAKLFLKEPLEGITGIHETAVIGKHTSIDKTAIIGPHVVIGNNVTIGPNTKLISGISVLDNVTIGQDCLIYSNVTIGHSCEIGSAVIINPGSTIGSEGYGFYYKDGVHHKVPQLGNVVIEDEVEIGANCTIDRGRFTQTRIGKGTKFDNLVHIAHNVHTGEHCLLLGQTGIAGSTKIGDLVTLAGQSGIVGHLKIPSRVTLYAKSLITKNLKEPGEYAGTPARPMKLWQKAIAQFYRGARS